MPPWRGPTRPSAPNGSTQCWKSSTSSSTKGTRRQAGSIGHGPNYATKRYDSDGSRWDHDRIRRGLTAISAAEALDEADGPLPASSPNRGVSRTSPHRARNGLATDHVLVRPVGPGRPVTDRAAQPGRIRWVAATARPPASRCSTPSETIPKSSRPPLQRRSGRLARPAWPHPRSLGRVRKRRVTHHQPNRTKPAPRTRRQAHRLVAKIFRRHVEPGLRQATSH